jgi:hypothetical protein
VSATTTGWKEREGGERGQTLPGPAAALPRGDTGQQASSAGAGGDSGGEDSAVDEAEEDASIHEQMQECVLKSSLYRD